MIRTDRLAHNDARQRRALQKLAEQAEKALRASQVVFINTDSSDPISNTANQTAFNIIPTLKANFFAEKGDVLDVIALGKHSTTGTPTLRLRCKFDDVTVFDSGAITCNSDASNEQWKFHVRLVAKTIGAGGRLNVHIMDGWLASRITAEKDAADLDTTVSHRVRWTAQWSAASASNTTRLELHCGESFNIDLS